MIIRLVRTGGFTGIPVRAAIDTGALDDQARCALEQMLTDARFFELPEKIMPEGQGADRFQYRLAVEDVLKSHAVEFSESGAPDELNELVQQITLLARRQQRGHSGQI